MAGFIATKLCGTDKEDRKADIESEGLMPTQINPNKVPEIKRRETDEEKMRIMKMKEEREQEIKQSQNSNIKTDKNRVSLNM